MILFKNVTLQRGLKVLLQDLNWTIYHKQRFGIIGENGSGKSSLFSLLLKRLQPEKGDIEIPKQIKLAHVAQETPAYEKSALEYVLDGDHELRLLEQELVAAEAMNNGGLIASLHDKLNQLDAYTAKSRAAQLLDGLGFKPDEQQKSVNEFSGGWRVRLNLAQALMCRSDVLLLDEPTNHLDLDAVIWLEKWLLNYKGTLLLISHDREFLDETIDHIAHFCEQQIKIYVGNYSSFEKQRAEQLLLQQAAYEKQQKKIAHLQSFVNRFRAQATKAKQAQSRVKAIERMELISATQADSPFQFHFKIPKQSPNPLLHLDDVVMRFGNKTVLNDVNLYLSPNERIGILGPNGAGKSTLIKILADELQASQGKREASSALRIGYFAQHQVDSLHLQETPLYHMRQIEETASEVELRTFLGSFGFVGDRVKEPVKNFSGGEKSRLALALIVWQQPNLLLLDEPTNHLDLEMRQALTLALQEYQGAMILVSHDRFLVRSTVDKLILVADQSVKEFDGDLKDYEKWLLEFRRQDFNQNKMVDNKNDLSRKSQRQMEAKLREERRPLLQKIKQLETNLDKFQQELTAIESLLAEPNIYEPQNKETLQQHLLSQAKLKKQIEQTEMEWLEACEKNDSI